MVSNLHVLPFNPPKTLQERYYVLVALIQHANPPPLQVDLEVTEGQIWTLWRQSCIPPQPPLHHTSDVLGGIVANG